MTVEKVSSNHILLTGATGFVGRHVLYELLREGLVLKFRHKIFLTVRDADVSAIERVKALFSGGSCPAYLMGYSVDLLMSMIRVIPVDLRSESLKEELAVIPSNELYVLHVAATTNLASTRVAESEVADNNINATLNLLDAIQGKAKKFVFISSSFASGDFEGEISNDYLHDPVIGENRNPYEKAKLLVERKVFQFCEAHQLPWQILRPSAVCGRLLDAPLNYVSKFDVFYGFGKIFDYLATKDKSEGPIRLLCQDQSLLNIIPVDYVAKVIVSAYREPIMQLNIVHKTSVPFRKLVDFIARTVNFTDYVFVDELPEDLSRGERLYYSSAGSIFTDYMKSPLQWFNTDALYSLMGRSKSPEIEARLPALLEYARACDFDSKNTARVAWEHAQEKLEHLAGVKKSDDRDDDGRVERRKVVA